MYLIVVGDARLEVDGLDDPLMASTGALVLLPHPGAHRLRDDDPHGRTTTLVLGAFHFRAAHRSLSIQRLSRAIHVPAGDPARRRG